MAFVCIFDGAEEVAVDETDVCLVQVVCTCPYYVLNSMPLDVRLVCFENLLVINEVLVCQNTCWYLWLCLKNIVV